MWSQKSGLTEGESKHGTTAQYSLNDSEDTKFIVVWVHCWWHVFNAVQFSFSCPGLSSLFHWCVRLSFLLTPKFLSAWFGLSIGNWACLTKPFSYDYIQCPCHWVSGQCPGGGDRACRFWLSNEITSHSGPVHQKTQWDQCWTAGLQRVAVLVKAASMSNACMKNIFCLGGIHCCFFHISASIPLVTAGRFKVKPEDLSVSCSRNHKHNCFSWMALFTTFQYITKLHYLKY